MNAKIKHLLPSRRKIIQLYFGLLLNANLKGFVTGNIYQGKVKVLCTPGLNCYSCPGAVGACPLGSLQGAFSAERSTLFYVGGILLLYSVLFGRMICGWVCPFGLIQELLHKIPTLKLKKNAVTRLLSYLKYGILVFFVFVIPMLYALRDLPLPAFCKYICPAGTLESGVVLLANKVNSGYFSMLGGLFTWKFLLMVSILTGCIFVFRLFCRFLCPLGALYGLFNRISFFGVTVEDSKCIQCGRCIRHCGMDIRHVGDPECIACGDCIAVCPTEAIRWKGGKISLAPNEGRPTGKRRLPRRFLAVLMALVLVCSIVFFQKESSTSVSGDGVQSTAADRPGLSYDLKVMDSSGLTGATLNPASTGNITIINFWGTWCTPCIRELPYFDQIASDYGENVTVVAIHSHLGSDAAPAYIEEYYPDSDLIFAVDDAADDTGLNGAYYTALGGRGTYPYTVILDEQGSVLEVFVSSVEYEDLQQAVEARLRSN